MRKTLSIGLYSVDPVGLTSFHAFDPESFFLVTTIADGLIHIDVDGAVQPALATSWERVAPTVVEFQLREGVQFHNGEDFDADSVIATFDAHRRPTPSASDGVLTPLAAVTKLSRFRVRIETKFPDAMLLRRLFWSEIYPKGILTKYGRDQLATRPIGTGAYRLVHWRPGREIVLERNAQHWANRATVDEIRLPIVRQKEWVDRLARGELDVAWNIDSSDRVRAARLPNICVGSRAAAVSQWFLLRNRGPLAHRAVRRALNHALNRPLLVELTEHGYGEPQRGIATRQQQGHTELESFRYSPELARRYLEEAGYGNGFALRGIISETSTAVYFMVREFLSRVGVRLEAEIVPRSEWIAKVVMGNLAHRPYDCDFAVASLDNPTLDSLFHQYILLFSHGPFSLTHDAEYDSQFLAAASSIDSPEVAPEQTARARLERYARDQALMLFTVQQQVHAAWREGVEVVLPRSGHFGAAAFWNIRVTDAEPKLERPRVPSIHPSTPDLDALLDGTSHTGTFYLRPGTTFGETAAGKVWSNIAISEERWHIQNEPMLKELVSQVEAKTSLANVLGSTDRVAIAGYSAERRVLFVNRGYELMFGGGGRTAFEILEGSGTRSWTEVEQEVAKNGAWLGAVAVRGAAEKKLDLYLSVTPAVDEEGATIGHTFVFSDFSGEQERIKHEAIRSILDNVPYGLFMCDPQGCLMPGFSDSLRRYIQTQTQEVVGVRLTELLGLGSREADHFQLCYDQLVEDFLPEQVSVDQLPATLQVAQKVCRLSASVIRDAAGGVKSVLFTLLDISEQIEAEHEVERLRSIVQVMRFRPSFETFARSLVETLEALASDAELASIQPEARRALHTAKGVLAQFGVAELAKRIHLIEDDPQITAQALLLVRQAIEQLIEQNHALWGIELARSEERFVVPESTLRGFEQQAASAQSTAQLRAILNELLARVRERSVSELAGPLAENHDLLCGRLGKTSRFLLKGGEVTCPAGFASVFDTLTHLVRNAVDHGIEQPGERGGKPGQATVELIATRTANEITLTVADDGHGIDVDKLAERALASGVTTQDALAGMSRQQKLQLIFADGVSTAKAVTDTSGRGVGMSAVQAAVASLSGAIEVDSELGKGTRIAVRLPLGTSTRQSEP